MVFVTNGTHAPGAGEAPTIIPAVPLTHGDLVVASGETYVIQPTGGVPEYYQGGNITVQAGGTLLVRNVILTFVQFVSDYGVPAQRVSHIYTFTDAGTVNFYNSTLTTDLNVINAYAKLSLDVSGAMTLWNSSLEFPGWITVSGATGSLTLNDSLMTGNPAAATAIEPITIFGDTQYAASLLVTGGAQFNAFHSVVDDTYADDTVISGIPGPAPLSAANVSLQAGGTNVTTLTTPTDSANLTLDWLYGPAGVAGGFVRAYYNDTLATPSSTTVKIWFDGASYTLGTLEAVNDTLLGVTVLPFPAPLTAAINAVGMLGYLNATGNFGTPGAIALNLSAVAGPDVTLSSAQVVLDPPLQYNLVATGAGTTISGVDSLLSLTFGTPPVSPLSQTAPFPWNSNKFLFENGATGYLGNLSVTSAIAGVFSSSALLTDATSTVYLYRWVQFNITGVSNHNNVSGASAHAFYAYDSNQASNATATALNELQSTSAAIWGYLQYWDAQHGAPAYGVSTIGGQASLLLASSWLSYSDLPSGLFLGGYHVGFRVPYVNATTWISAAVSPYPTGVAYGTLGYRHSDGVYVSVPVAPPVVRFVSFVTPTSPLDLNNYYTSSGVLFLNGPGTAEIVVTARPVGGGNPVIIASTPNAANGSFDFAWSSLQGQLSPGTTYTISATATYQTASATYLFPIDYSVPATTSAVGFLYEKFLGLPLWLWIVIAVAAVAAILVVLLVFRRQAAGKLVECGECGELIPEDATVCPKCGAEFESDLVRCSRCSSTIPAISRYCPECSAQLLGKPGEGDSDPERQAYVDFTEKYRAEGKKELGDNYTESAFWDWWKRQPTYVPFSQWKVQQNKGTPRAGMSEPPVGSEIAPDDAPVSKRSASASAEAAPGAGPGFTAPPRAAEAPAATSSGALKPCPNCTKEIPPEYLVCPFCGAVTQ